jgi:hypothetical protein
VVWLQDERYIVTYNPTKDKVYALLKDQAKPDDILKAAFHVSVDCILFGRIPLLKFFAFSYPRQPCF